MDTDEIADLGSSDCVRGNPYAHKNLKKCILQTVDFWEHKLYEMENNTDPDDHS